MDSEGYLCDVRPLSSHNLELAKLCTEAETRRKQEALDDGIPVPGLHLVNYTRRLAFEEKQDYSYLRRLFRLLFLTKGFRYDHVFDWTEKSFNEMQSNVNHTVP